jgi:hypothetical protein
MPSFLDIWVRYFAQTVTLPRFLLIKETMDHCPNISALRREPEECENRIEDQSER